jgi:hypothetical protein
MGGAGAAAIRRAIGLGGVRVRVMVLAVDLAWAALVVAGRAWAAQAADGREWVALAVDAPVADVLVAADPAAVAARAVTNNRATIRNSAAGFYPAALFS